MIKVYFADDSVRKEYEKLSSNSEFSGLFRSIQKSIDEIKVGDSVSIDYTVSADGKNLALNISLEKPEAVSTPEEETSAPEIAPAEEPSQ